MKSEWRNLLKRAGNELQFQMRHEPKLTSKKMRIVNDDEQTI